MLDRIKKKQYEGFKEFVQNMEVTPAHTRAQIFLSGVLEDPVFMGHVMKNIHTFDDILNLPSHEIDALFKGQELMPSFFAKALYGATAEKIKALETIIPRWLSQVKDELSFLTTLTPGQQESAKFFVMKGLRKLQHDDRINGFRWNLPGQDVFYPKNYPDGKCQIQFENGVLAAEGEIMKGKRLGFWRHFYDTGKVLAEGEYSDNHKTGTWVFYHGTGSHKSQGKYKADQREGHWKEWDRSGELTEIEYENGAKKI